MIENKEANLDDLKDNTQISKSSKPKETILSSNAPKIENNNNIESTKNSVDVDNQNNIAIKKESPKPIVKKQKRIKKKIPVANRVISEEEIINGPLLSIEEVGNSSLLNHNKLMINPGGLIGGRKIKDGVTYFTMDYVDENSADNESLYTDFALKINIDEKKADTIDDFIFIVYYKPETLTYYIKFGDKAKINEDMAIHLKGNMSIPINHSEMIYFGKELFQLRPDNKNGTITIINLSEKAKHKIKKDYTYEFSYKNVNITIGRGEQCDISLRDCESDISKIQCTVSYSNEKVWMIRDGYEDKESTNGTWLIAAHSYPLYDNMEIEVFSSLIKVNYY